MINRASNVFGGAIPGALITSTPVFRALYALVFMGFCAAPARAEGTGFVEPRLSFGGDSLGVDLQVGGRFGYELYTDSRVPLAIFLDGDVRTFSKPVRIPATQTFSYQFHESRWAVGTGISARYPLGKFSPLIATGVQYTAGSFEGSRREPENGFVGWLEGGFQWAWNDVASWGLSWQYRPLPETSSGRLLLSFGFRFE